MKNSYVLVVRYELNLNPTQQYLFISCWKKKESIHMDLGVQLVMYYVLVFLWKK